MLVRYYIDGREVLYEADGDPPRVGDEVSMQIGRFDDEKVYRVARVVRRKPDCPPDDWHVHLVLTEPEELATLPGWQATR